MKSKIFDRLLEAWYFAELNRINEGAYGLGEQTRTNALGRLEERKKKYKED
jgi:hypothetical protein